jgi:hypothetical protein
MLADVMPSALAGIAVVLAADFHLADFLVER